MEAALPWRPMSAPESCNEGQMHCQFVSLFMLVHYFRQQPSRHWRQTFWPLETYACERKDNFSVQKQQNSKLVVCATYLTNFRRRVPTIVRFYNRKQLLLQDNKTNPETKAIALCWYKNFQQPHRAKITRPEKVMWDKGNVAAQQTKTHINANFPIGMLGRWEFRTSDRQHNDQLR